MPHSRGRLIERIFFQCFDAAGRGNGAGVEVYPRIFRGPTERHGSRKSSPTETGEGADWPVWNSPETGECRKVALSFFFVAIQEVVTVLVCIVIADGIFSYCVY